MPWPNQDPAAIRREQLHHALRDMAVASAMDVHKARLEHADATAIELNLKRLVHEVCQLAVFTAIERYDVENRTMVARIESHERERFEQEMLRPPSVMMLDPAFAALANKGVDKP